MIVTVEGYQGKKNRSAFVASALAAMSAMKYGEKTLAINLIDNNTDSIERLMLNDTPTSELKNDTEASLSEDGIDQLLREADVKKLLKSDFDKSVRAALTLENRLDIAVITRNDLFTAQLGEKAEALNSVLQQAKNYYDNIVILMKSTKGAGTDSSEPYVSNAYEYIKNLVDARIVCVRQGCKHKYNLEGKKLIWLVTDYDDESKFSINNTSKEFIGTINTYINTGKSCCMKLPYCTQANDACISGTVLKFVRNNRNAVGVDVNYGWVKAMDALFASAFGKKDVEVAVDWENAAFLDGLQPKKLFHNIEEVPMEAPVERAVVDFDESVEPEKPSRKEIRAKINAEKEKKRQMEEEARRIEAEEERKRQKELARQEAERKAKEDEERLQRELEAALERKRLEEEAERRRQEEEERRRQEEKERKRREAAERKRQAEEEIQRLQEQIAIAQQNAAEAAIAAEDEE